MIDTAGNEQKRIIPCQCGLTGGCLLCNPHLSSINYSRLSITETNWKKFLTEEILKECWHDIDEFGDIYYCKKCRKTRLFILLGKGRSSDNRAFDNRNDMMDLYEAAKRDGRKWEEYLVFLWPTYLDASKYNLNNNAKTSRGAFVSWLFCLDGADYEDRCKMVAEFYGWEEEK